MENIDTTQLVAWIGATTGIASLLWNIYLKMTAGPKLRVTAFANKIMMPAPPGDPHFLQITVRNIGSATTTLTNAELFPFVSRWQRFLSKVRLRKKTAETRAVLNRYRGPQLPQKLEVGSEWQILVEQDLTIDGWLNTRTLQCAVWHSFSKRPVPATIVKHPRKKP
jgi:hypothetical protein